MLFSFGRDTVRITDNTAFRHSISPVWQKYEATDPDLTPDVKLTIEEGIIAHDTPVSDGWSYRKENGNEQAVFSRGGNKRFAIQYGSDNRKATIIVEKPAENLIRLGIQFGFLLVGHKKYVGFHGVTLLCGNEIIILSAPSGTGKTTLAKLLEKYYDAIIINGDFALLSLSEEGVVFEPTPFCGTSRRALNHRFRVNRVVFLGQAKDNHWRELSGREAVTRFMSNAFVPDWDSELQKSVQENILKCISMLKLNVYDFAPTQEAAEMFSEKIVHDI